MWYITIWHKIDSVWENHCHLRNEGSDIGLFISVKKIKCRLLKEYVFLINAVDIFWLKKVWFLKTSHACGGVNTNKKHGNTWKVFQTLLFFYSSYHIIICTEKSNTKIIGRDINSNLGKWSKKKNHIWYTECCLHLLSCN